jgi:hypothetical protein
MVLFIPGSESLSVISLPAGPTQRCIAAGDMEHTPETVPPGSTAEAFAGAESVLER